MGPDSSSAVAVVAVVVVVVAVVAVVVCLENYKQRNTACAFDIRLYWALKMLIFWLPGLE